MTKVTEFQPRQVYRETMKQLNLHDFKDFNDQQVGRRILVDDPVMRVVLVSLRAGQSLPEHATNGLVTVYSVSGRVLFYEEAECCEMRPGKLVRLSPGRTHRLEAAEDSQLLVTLVKQSDAAAWTALSPVGREVDLRQTPRERRHPIVFYAFDVLAEGESFFLVNDHDPRPLRAQLEQLRPGEMSWDYEVQGPTLFRIKVSRIAAGPGQVEETVLAGNLPH